MGWSNGTELMEDIINIAMRYIPNEVVRQRFFSAAINSFERQDWDCQTEPMGIDPAFDRALQEKHPEWFDGSEE